MFSSALYHVDIYICCRSERAWSERSKAAILIRMGKKSRFFFNHNALHASASQVTTMPCTHLLLTWHYTRAEIHEVNISLAFRIKWAPREEVSRGGVVAFFWGFSLHVVIISILYMKYTLASIYAMPVFTLNIFQFDWTATTCVI